MSACGFRFEGSTGVVDGDRIDGTTKGGRSRVVGIDRGTRLVLEKHRLAQAADRALAGPEWHVSDLVFTSQLGRPLFPDTLTQLMPKLIEAHNSPMTPARRSHPAEPLPRPSISCRSSGCMTCATCMRRCYSSRAFRFTSWRTASDTPTLR